MKIVLKDERKIQKYHANLLNECINNYTVDTRLVLLMFYEHKKATECVLFSNRTLNERYMILSD